MTTKPKTTTPATLPSDAVTYMNPALVFIGENVRSVSDGSDDGLPQLDDTFVESIREWGVLNPLLCYQDDDGRVFVTDGQCRLLAARMVGATAIPLVISTKGATELPERIAKQLVLNDRRTGLRESDRIRAFHQLALAGHDVDWIALKTGTKKERVKASLTVGMSQPAVEAMDVQQVTLETALYLAEFEDDAAVRESIINARTDQWHLERVVSNARFARDGAIALAARRAALDAEGIKYTADEDDEPGTMLSSLTNDVDSKSGHSPISPADHLTCPGHAVQLSTRRGEVMEWAVCTDPLMNGHAFRNGSGSRGPETEEQAEARKAARRRLIELNKEWDATVDLRRAWLATVFTRKTLPTDAAVFVAVTLTQFSYEVGDSGQSLAHQIAGLKNVHGYNKANALANYAEKYPTKAGHVLFALALGGLENITSRETWRNPSSVAIHYFTRLEAWGYPLSRVEKLVLSGGEASLSD